MDGTGIDLVVIPIVAVLSLAVWLAIVLYVAAHPHWKGQAATTGRARTTDQGYWPGTSTGAPGPPQGDADASTRALLPRSRS
jgi:hypothetical protein